MVNSEWNGLRIKNNTSVINDDIIKLFSIISLINQVDQIEIASKMIVLYKND